MDDQAHLLEKIYAARRTIATRVIAHEQCATLPHTTVTMQQLRLLMLLRVHGPLGGHVLARHLDVSMPTVTGVVGRLVERGLVERGQDPSDRRVRLVGLSEHGRELVTEYESMGWSAGVEMLRRLEVVDLRALAQGLTALADVVSRVTEHPAPSEARGTPGTVADEAPVPNAP